MASVDSLPDIDSAEVAPEGLDYIPTLDLASPDEALVGEIAAACRDWGFFQVVNHGVDEAVIERLRAVTRAFFALPREAKRRYLRTLENPWGYYDRELTKERRDKKEVFDFGPDIVDASVLGAPFVGYTRLPDQPPGFAAAVRDYFEAVTALARRLALLIGDSLGDRGAIADACLRSDTSFLRLNFYPVEDPMAGEAADRAGLGVHHHTDSGVLTVLLQDEVRGLQVYREGRWYGIEPVAGAFTINIADMVQIWSNDRYRAPLHRVEAMTNRDRTSIPFFFNPSYSAVVAPLATDTPHYRPVHWGEFRRRRADGDFASYGTEVQISDFAIEGAGGHPKP